MSMQRCELLMNAEAGLAKHLNKFCFVPKQASVTDAYGNPVGALVGLMNQCFVARQGSMPNDGGAARSSGAR